MSINLYDASVMNFPSSLNPTLFSENQPFVTSCAVFCSSEERRTLP